MDVGALHLLKADGTLEGSTANDMVGNGTIVELPNGNMMVLSPNFENGAATNAGAATLINGTTGLSGTNGDFGSAVVLPLGGTAGSNYMLILTAWNNGAAADAGAVRFCSGTTPATGLITASNALVGSTANDSVGNFGLVQVLSNGNYVVVTSTRDDGALANAGAVTLGKWSHRRVRDNLRIQLPGGIARQ